MYSVTNQLSEQEYREALIQRQGWIGKYVIWLKKPRDKRLQIPLLTLTMIAAFFLSITFIGAKPVRKGYRVWKKWSAYARYYRALNDLSPPNIQLTGIKTERVAFNHLFSFAIDQDLIWVKPHNHETDWRPIYFDGFEDHLVPMKVSCDGANLIVIDNKNQVHYKKVIKEWRDPNLQYHYVDKTIKDNWKPRWYTFPVLSSFYHFLGDRRLTLPENRSWTISHRGQYVYWYEDICQKTHPDPIGTTTIYLLPPDGHSILFSDPWLPFGFYWKISWPDEEFTASSLSASGSTLFLFGYHSSGQPKLYTRLADFDTTGRNPLNSYSYDKQNNDPNVIILPPEEWKLQPSISLKEGLQFTDRNCILQTGIGNQSRELRVEAIDVNGNRSYYAKKLNDPNWTYYG